MIECEQCELWFYMDYVSVSSVPEHWSAIKPVVQLLQIKEVHPVVLQFLQKQ